MDGDHFTCEDLLVQLYTLDSTIEEHYELGTDDPQFDEDHASEAYESILQACNRYPPEQEGESTLKTVIRTIAARFLAQHFYKFPHVQMHAMDALVSMCGSEHVVAVRMQGLQSLWWILKMAVRGRDALSSLCRQRIQSCVDMILDGKKEGEEDDEDDEEVTKRSRQVMERVAKQVQETLDKAAHGNAGDGQGDGDKKSLVSPPRRTKSHTSRSYPREERMSRSRSRTPSPNRPRRPERSERRPSPEPIRSRREERKSSRRSRTPSPRPSSRSSQAPPITVPLNPKHCPPGPHLFIGGVPRDAIPSDLVSFLAPVDPGLTSTSIIIKMPSQSLPAGYAFVNMTSTTHAIDAIHYVKTTPYKTGRPLICDFARGPPTPLIRFIERQNLANPSLHGHDAVHLVNFDEKPPFVWKQLCRELDKIGRVDEMDAEERRHGGLIRFDDVECAKALIRRHHLIIEGYEVMPIYYAKGNIAPGTVVSYTNDPKPMPREGGKQIGHRSYRDDHSRSPPRHGSSHGHSTRKDSPVSRRPSYTSSSHHHHSSSSSRYEEAGHGRYEEERGRRSSRSPSRERLRSSRTRDDRSIAEIARDVKTSRYPTTRRTSASRSPSLTRRPSSGRTATVYDGHHARRPTSSSQPLSSSRYKKRSRSYDGDTPYPQRSRVERGGSNGMYKRREKNFEDNVDELMVDYDEEE